MEAPGVQVLSVDLAMAEISAKLARVGRPDLASRSLQTVEELSEVLLISREVAEATGPLLLQLRREDPQASLADAVMLAAARSKEATLVSNGACYRGQSDVART